MRALNQSGKARSLQGPSLESLPHDRGLERLHVAAVQLFSLLRIERLGLVLIKIVRRAITVTVVAVAAKPGWATTRVSHENFRHGVTALALAESIRGTSRRVEWSIKKLVGLDSRDLRGGRLVGHRMLYPPLEPRLTGSLAAVPSGDSG